jgi:hypothetical protein
MDQAVPYLQSDAAVFRYAWFTGRSSGSPQVNLLDSGSGALTPLGTEYTSLAPTCR